MHPLVLCLVVLVVQATYCSFTTAFFLHPAAPVRFSSIRRTTQTRSSIARTYSLPMDGLSNTLDSFEHVLQQALFPKGKEPTKEDPFQELACFENLATGTETNPAYESLTKYLQLWAFALQQDPNALATPISTGTVRRYVLWGMGRTVRKTTLTGSVT
jgi:hypothetical protein